MTEQSINVLVIRTPRAIEDIEACMAHIRQGLCEGVLILGADIKYSVEQFPPLGYAAVEDARGEIVFDLRRGEITEPEGEAEAAEDPPRGGAARRMCRRPPKRRPRPASRWTSPGSCRLPRLSASRT